MLVDNYPLLRVFETGTGAHWPLKQTEQHLDLSTLFNDDAFSKSHSFWVKILAIELFKLFDGESLAKVASKQTSFAVSMIPLLVKALLMTKSNADLKAMNDAVNLFFSKNFAKISSVSMEVKIIIWFLILIDTIFEIAKITNNILIAYHFIHPG